MYYRVQTGAFRKRENADRMLYLLQEKGYPAYILQDGELYDRLLEYGNPLLALAASMAFLMLVRLKKSEFNPSEQAKKWIDRFCGCSFGIYLIHIMFLDVYKRNIKPETFSAWIMIPVVSVGLVLLSFGCVWLIRKTKTGRRTGGLDHEIR